MSPDFRSRAAPRWSRRRLFGTALAVLPLAVAAGRARAQSKMTKGQASYRDQPNGDMRCGNCNFFQAEETACRLVEGDISTDGYCRLWSARR